MRHRNPYTGQRVRIVRTADTCWGAPRIDGTRIETRLVWELVQSGRTHQDIFDEYGIPRWEIDAAVAYEKRLVRRLGRRIEVLQVRLCRRWGLCDD